ncbi:MAG: hypothetical protein HBSAPP03_10960 [Phycisphaerae bacterium]|nr:MAG: hypothetical protein HBSAPP03_10960 [Phycisphaerae bacterium]
MRGMRLLAVGLAYLATFAAWGISITITPSAQSSGNQTGIAAGSDLTITTAFTGGGYSEVEIVINGGTGAIGDISIVATSNIPVSVRIIGTGTGGTCGPIDSIDTSGSTASVTLFEVKSGGHIGTIYSGNIQSILSLPVSGNGWPGTVGSITVAPASGGHTSSIFSVNAGGGVLGNIIAESGSIGQIVSTGTSGTIGMSSTPISIRALTGIGLVQSREVYADISGPSGNEFGPTFTYLSTSHGPFVGSIKAANFSSVVLNSTTYAAGIDITGGDLDADITIAGDYTFDPNSSYRVDVNVLSSGRAIPAGRTITIGGGLYGSNSEETPVAFDLPANGLEGQIIINAANSDPDSWTAPIRVDGIKLDNARSQPHTAPYYDRLSSELGGGSVGLVPYHLHKTDCVPYDSAEGYNCMEVTTVLRTWPASHGGEERETIVLRHYGPVFDGEDGSEEDDPATNPLIIKRRGLVLCSPTPCEEYEECWTDRSERFDVYVVGGLTREVWIAMKLDEEDEPQNISQLHRYKVELRDMAYGGGTRTQLRSGMTFFDDTNAPPVGGYPYEYNPYCEFFSYSPPNQNE